MSLGWGSGKFLTVLVTYPRGKYVSGLGECEISSRVSDISPR